MTVYKTIEKAEQNIFSAGSIEADLNVHTKMYPQLQP
jgi:hypothetical protein